MRTFFTLFFLLCCPPAFAQKKTGKFISEEDGALDMSEFLNSTTGFLPVPIIITEPAVGLGGGIALAYFHKRKGEQGDRPKGLSPTVSFGAGAYTSNGTWMVGGGHQGSYKDDRWRYLGALAYVSANLTFYGGGILPRENEYEFNMKGFFTIQELLYRVKKETPFFIGLNYIYFNNTISFETGLDIPELERLEVETSIGGINTAFLYDGRNNSLTPTKGFYSMMEIGAFNEALGGTGFRYLLAKQYGLHTGIDISRGPEIWAWNITVGSNWGR